MITHCPSCRTRFRVHADQLAARAGQVRCGKCSRVFDALEHLVEEHAPLREPSAAQERAATGADAAMAAPAPVIGTGLGAETQEPALAQGASAAAETAESGAGTPIAASGPAQLEDAKPQAEPAANSFDFGPNAAAQPASQARRWTWLLGRCRCC